MADGTQSAMKMASQLKGINTEGIEVDEEQVPPSIAAESKEEAEELAKMEALVQAAGVAEVIGADKATKLLCLRGRKYDAERAAALLPKLLENDIDSVAELRLCTEEDYKEMGDFGNLEESNKQLSVELTKLQQEKV